MMVGVNDVVSATWESPLGTLMLEVSSVGLRSIALVHCHNVSPWSSKKSSNEIANIIRELSEYFTGERTLFSIPLDLSTVPSYRRKVLEQLATVPYGDRVSYRDLAIATENPHAVRAVGGACANNPIPVVIPCHRVVRADGSLGGFSWGISAKKYLLNLEYDTVMRCM